MSNCSVNEISMSEVIGISEVVQKLNDYSRYAWREGKKIPKNAREARNRLLSNRSELPDGKLTGILEDMRQRKKVDFGKYVIYLPPLEGDSEFVTILSLSCDFGVSRYKISLEVEMYRWLEEEKKVRGIGFRFERGSGKHEYYHVQVIKKNRSSDRDIIECPQWIPTNVPCVPTTADCSFCLVICMLVCFYGKGFYKKVFQDLNIPKDCKESMKKLSPIL